MSVTPLQAQIATNRVAYDTVWVHQTGHLDLYIWDHHAVSKCRAPIA